MKQHTIITYSFNELSKEAQKKAIHHYSDVNVDDSDWWESIYDDLTEIGLQCVSFDIDRNYCKLKFIKEAEIVAKNILEKHRENTDTYKDTKYFLNDFNLRNDKLQRIENILDYFFDREDWNNTYINLQNKKYAYEEALENIQEDFLNDLQESYLIILRKNYEYLTSEESIIETIIARDYQFLKTGKPYVL